MSDNNKEETSKLDVIIAKYGLIQTIIAALLSTIGIVLVAYFGYLGLVKSSPTTTVPVPTQEFAQSLILTQEPSQENTEDKLVLPIDDLPFNVFGWTYTDVESERGEAHLGVINDNQGNKHYNLQYYLPVSSTQPSWSGIAFTFSNSTDLNDYEYLSISITFGSPEAVCNLDMRDISEKGDHVLIGLNRVYPDDITVVEVGHNQIIKIPIHVYYNQINKKAVKDLGCSVSTDFAQGKNEFTINNIEFSK
jgi:hypothetical protein